MLQPIVGKSKAEVESFVESVQRIVNQFSAGTALEVAITVTPDGNPDEILGKSIGEAYEQAKALTEGVPEATSKSQAKRIELSQAGKRKGSKG